MADQLLTKTARMVEIQASLQAAVPAGVTVLIDGDGGIAPELTPFVVLSGALAPSRPALDGGWSLAAFTLAAYTVHRTQLEAEALADLVRVWALTQAGSLTGVIDVEVRDEALPTDPGNVPQVRESWTLTLVRV